MSIFKSFMNQTYSDYSKVHVTGISIDSRCVRPNDLFIAMKGNRVDGHQFIEQAVESGASLIVSENEIETTVPVIRVQSSQEFLIEFAGKWWENFNMPVIGITGSNGKTTTKELLVHVLKPFVSVAWMPGNYNSTIGLPLSLFAMPVSCDAGVFEMGTNTPGEIKKLTDLIKPKMGLITNIHSAHIEFFSSLSQITQEKAELFKCLPPEGTAFVNLDDPQISSIETQAKIITYGNHEDADFYGRREERNESSVFFINGKEITLPQNNETMAKNTLAVYAVSLTLGLCHEDIVHQIASFKIPEGRGNMIEKNGITVINDTYNANPESVRAGVEFALSIFPKRRHILILGDMFELGKDAIEYHMQLGEFISRKSNVLLLTYGELSRAISDICASRGLNCHHFKKIYSITQFIKSIRNTGDIFYVKGSRGMRMENIIEKGILS